MITPSWYRLGTASVSTGSTTVTGSGVGSWQNNASAGDVILLNGVPYEVLSITDGANSTATLELATPYTGTTLASGSYAIIRSFSGVTPSELARRTAETLQDYHRVFDQLLYWMTGGGNGAVATMTLEDFAGVSGLQVPTLPNLAPLAAAVSTTSSPYKVPKADANGKLDINWLPAQVVSAIYSASAAASSGSNGSQTTNTYPKITRTAVTTNGAVVDINSKVGRFFDIVVSNVSNFSIRLNYVNAAPAGTDLLHDNVPEAASLPIMIRVLDTTGSLGSITWTGCPVAWDASNGSPVSYTANSVSIFRLNWLNIPAAVASTLSVSPVSIWVGETYKV